MKKTILTIWPLWTLIYLYPTGLSEKQYIRANYSKFEYRIPMRDGVRLFTSIYLPNDRSHRYPILLYRSPYSSRPYGLERYRTSLGPSKQFTHEGYIFVYQDVRGRFLSEGNFVQMTPHRTKKESNQDVDESTDTYDTIEWLLSHLDNHNGKVGQWGISYPGFYTAAGMIDSHPALKAASPQAPIGDFYFDDFHHHGAFFLAHAFRFLYRNGKPRPEPTTEPAKSFEFPTPDGYQFFLDLGSLSNVNRMYFKGKIDFWNQIIAHPTYDSFWEKRSIVKHLKNIGCAVMTVGGWFDAEDLYGPLQIYQSIEQNNPDIFNILVMGPWSHADWGRKSGSKLGNANFGFETDYFYRNQILHPFFNYHLKEKGDLTLPEAYVFETGANRWRTFDQWPPKSVKQHLLYFRDQERLSFEPPMPGEDLFDEYVSDPARPVPFTQEISPKMTSEYMTDDQRFAARRPDVLVYQTPVLEYNLTLAGPIKAELWVSTSGGDADWVVKLIDVMPNSAPDPKPNPGQVRMGGYQMLIRSEVIRGRFRNSYENPEPFESNQVTRVTLPLQDVFHTFQKGHRIMVQIQSSWFPLVDRNPQRYVPNIFKSNKEDFIKAIHRVYHSEKHTTHLKIGTITPTDHYQTN